jgi:hypothetical protein
MLWGSSILVKSAWCPGGFLCLNKHNFSRFEKFSVIVLFKMLLIPLLVPLLLLQCPWFSSLVFWWGPCFLVYSFHRTCVVWLIILQFFLYLPFIFKFWDSVFWLFQSAGVIFHFILYFCFILFWGFPFHVSLPLYCQFSSLIHLSIYGVLCFNLMFI